MSHGNRRTPLAGVVPPLTLRAAAAGAGRRLALVAAAACAAGCAAAGQGTDTAAYRPDLSGTWVLDAAAGNDSTALALALADSADPRLLRVRGGHLTGGGWNRADTLYRAPDPVRTARLALAIVREPPPRVTISVADAMVTFRFAEQQDVALGTTWQRTVDGWGDGRAWRMRARWRAGRLEVERQQPDGDVRLREYYSRSPGADRLVVWTAIELPGDELTVRRVYRLAEPAARSEGQVELTLRNGPRARRP
jgi:hypothetical protein